jgi:hypothetical protein
MAIVAMIVAGAGSARAEPEGANDKRLGVGLGLSLGGTVAGVAVAASAFALRADHPARDVLFATGGTAALVMPTAGHWYARGRLGGWTAGAYTRLAGVCVAGVGAMLHIGRDDEVDGKGTLYFARGVLYGGLGLVVGGALLDIALVPSTVRRANRRPNKAIDITLGPALVRGGGGVAIGGSF